MAVFTIGTTVDTTTPTVTVDVSSTNLIKPGTHHFQLIVIDDQGVQSDAVTATVVVKDPVKPTAVLAITPSQVTTGQSFTLDGSKSAEVAPGKIAKFQWTMVD